MQVPLRVFLVFLAVATGEFNIALAMQSGSENPAANIKINLEFGLLTLEARNTPLTDILSKIGEVAGFRLIQLANFSENPLVSANFERLSIEKVVESLVDDTDRIIFYTHSDESQQRVISQLWLLGSDGVAGDKNVRNEGPDNSESENRLHFDDKIRSEAVLRLAQQSAAVSAHDEGPVIAQLVRILQEDQNPLVRARATIALGVLQDERAVIALESALADKHASVRTQAISALGQIGGEKAISILGNILSDSRKIKLERIMAAQALWKQDSKVAQGYLSAAANDQDEQVRLASSNAPLRPSAGSVVKQFGFSETE